MTIQVMRPAYAQQAPGNSLMLSRQDEFNHGTSSGRTFGALTEAESGPSLAQSMRDFVPNTQTEDAQASLASAIESL